jgi:hypothetical protein
MWVIWVQDGQLKDRELERQSQRCCSPPHQAFKFLTAVNAPSSRAKKKQICDDAWSTFTQRLTTINKLSTDYSNHLINILCRWIHAYNSPSCCFCPFRRLKHTFTTSWASSCVNATQFLLHNLPVWSYPQAKLPHWSSHSLHSYSDHTMCIYQFWSNNSLSAESGKRPSLVDYMITGVYLPDLRHGECYGTSNCTK